MTRFETAIDIAAAPGRAWEVLADFVRWPEWTASMTSLTPLSPPPVGVGSRWRVVQPKLQPAVFRVTDWQPGRSFDWVMGGPLLGARAGHRIEPAPGGHARLVLTLEYTGALGPLVALGYGALTRRYMAMEAEGLRARAEGRR